MTCLALGSPPVLVRRRLNSLSNTSELSGFYYDDLDNLNLMFKKVNQRTETTILKRPSEQSVLNSSRLNSMSEISLVQTKNCVGCACPVRCWLKKVYRTVIGNKKKIKEDGKFNKHGDKCRTKSKDRKNMERSRGKSVSTSCLEETCSIADNLSWDESADFLGSFLGSVPFTTLEMPTSTPARKGDWIHGKFVDHLSPEALPTTLFDSPDCSPIRRHRQSVSNQTEPVLHQHRDSLSSSLCFDTSYSTLELSTRSIRKIECSHRKLGQLRDEVAQVRAEIDKALKLCQQVQNELEDIKGSRQSQNNLSMRVWESKDSGFHQPSADRLNQSGCDLDAFMLFLNQNQNHSGLKNKWKKTFVEHRIFLEEMKYHFRWKQGVMAF